MVAGNGRDGRRTGDSRGTGPEVSGLQTWWVLRGDSQARLRRKALRRLTLTWLPSLLLSSPSSPPCTPLQACLLGLLRDVRVHVSLHLLAGGGGARVFGDPRIFRAFQHRGQL